MQQFENQGKLDVHWYNSEILPRSARKLTYSALSFNIQSISGEFNRRTVQISMCIDRMLSLIFSPTHDCGA